MFPRDIAVISPKHLHVFIWYRSYTIIDVKCLRLYLIRYHLWERANSKRQLFFYVNAPIYVYYILKSKSYYIKFNSY